MDKQTDLQTQLRKIISEYSLESSQGPQIVINGPIIFGADIATLNGLKLILQALVKQQDIIAPSKIKTAP